MAQTQGGLQNISEVSGVSAVNMSEVQKTSVPYQFGDITRANFGKGSEVAANRSFNAGELFMDNNRVGLNPFQQLTPYQGTKLHTIG